MNIFSNELKQSILKHFALENDPLEKQEKFLQSLEQLSNQVALNTILSKLSDDECLIFLRLCENGEDQKALEYAKQKYPNLEQEIVQQISQAVEELEN